MSISIGNGLVHLWKQGELLHPEFLSAEVLDEQRQLAGEADFSAQYLQRPIPSGGGAIDTSKIKRWTVLPKVTDFCFLSIDASSGVESGSFSIIQLWAASKGAIYLIGQERARLDFPTLRTETIRIADKFKVRFILIEKASAGFALLQELHNHYPIEEAHEKLVPIAPKLPKEVRVARAMILIEDGKLFLPENAPFMDALISEFQSFPKGAHDDQVYATSQAANWFRLHLQGPPEVKVSSILY